MAGTLRLRTTVDVRATQQDLQAIADGLDRPITDVLAKGAEDIADLSRGFMRKRDGSWPTSSAFRDFPGQIADYYDSKSNKMSANIGSRHPAAPVWEWGGDIHPASGSAKHAAIRGFRHGDPRRAQIEAGHQVIHIPRLQPVGHAGDALEDDLAQKLEDAVGRLIQEYGF